MKMIDLSQLIHEKMPVFPGATRPVFQQMSLVESNGYRVARVTMDYHAGTHIDAPAHMLSSGKTLDELPIDYFAGTAVIADFSKWPLETIPLEALQAFSPLLEQTEYLLLKTGWSRYWGSDRYFEPYPVLSPEAAKWLTNFPLKGIGLDAISIDRISSTDFAIHRILLASEILIIENLTNLDAIDRERFDFFCLPLRIKDADGSPVRASVLLR